MLRFRFVDPVACGIPFDYYIWPSIPPVTLVLAEYADRTNLSLTQGLLVDISTRLEYMCIFILLL